jgi:hypothetical protein
MAEIFPGYGRRPPTRTPRAPRSKPVQRSIAFTPAAKVQAARLTFYAVGGWPECSAYIDPRSVPLCTHEHGEVDPELKERLVKLCLIPAYFARRCLTAEWRGHEAGTDVITYGSVGEGSRFDLWVVGE